MAKLTKQDYEHRQNNAGLRMMDNQQIALQNGMAEEQIEAIERLCSARHNMHCDIDSLVRNQSNTLIVQELVAAGVSIYESGLPSVPGLPSYDDDYIDIDDLYTIQEYEDDIPEDEEEYNEWRDTKYEEIYDQWEDLNTAIENYLADIDRQYNTNYCPTGKQRY